jgi:hypothetical protein
MQNASIAELPARSQYFRPEYFRLPKAKENDPFFGLTRAYYYMLEARGLLKFVRIRDKGKEKGITLIRYRDVLNVINKSRKE